MTTLDPSTTEIRHIVADRLRRLARAQGRLDELTARLERELDAARERHAARIGAVQRRVERMHAALERYCRAEREAILPDGRKSLPTPFGEISFRKAEACLEVVDGVDEVDVCAALKAEGLGELVRVRECLDKRGVRRVIDEGRLAEDDLSRLGLALVRKPDQFTCKLCRDTLVELGRAGA